MTWRDELQKWRKAASKIQKEAAEEIGVPFSTYQSWECKGSARKRVPPKYVQDLIREKIYGD